MRRNSLSTWERRARLTMGAIAGLAALTGLLVKAGWISTEPVYNEHAWYAVSERAGLVITTEYADESGCRAATAQSAAASCRSGQALSRDARLISS